MTTKERIDSVAKWFRLDYPARFRIAVFLLIAILLVANLGTVLVLTWAVARLIESYDARAVITAEGARAVVERLRADTASGKTARVLLNSLRVSGGYVHVSVYDSRGGLIVEAGAGERTPQSFADSARSLAVDAFAGVRDAADLVLGGTEVRASVEVAPGDEPIAVVLAEPAEVHGALVRATRWEAAVRMFAAAVVIVVALVLVRDAVRPYRRVSERAKTLPDVDRYAMPQKVDAPGFVADAFERVADSLEQKHHALLEAHAALKARAGELEEFASLVLRSMPSGVVGIDAAGRVTRFNETASKILGLRAEDVLAKPVAEVLASYPLLLESLHLALETGADRRREVFDLAVEGASLVIGGSVSPVVDPIGDRVGAVALFADLTEVRRLREQTRASERMAAFGEAAAGLAHEVRNSLAAVLADVRLVARDGSIGEQTREAVDRIAGEARSLGQLIDRMLELGRDVAPRKRKVELADVIHDAVRRLESRLKKDGVVVEITGRATAWCDPELMRVATENVIANSMDALSCVSGSMRVRAELGESADRAVLSFVDNGPGFPREVIDRVFEPFVTARPGGVGLGLALVRKIVLAHGGSVSAGNTAGGAQVTIELPKEA